MTDTQPTLPLPPHPAPQAPRRRRRVWPWIVSALVVVVLAIAAALIADWIAKDAVTKAVQQQVRARFSLAAGQPVDVRIDGPVIPQMVAGTLGRVEIAADDVTIRGFTGDVRVVLHDVHTRDGFTMSGGEATATLDLAQLRTLLSGVDGVPADSVGLSAPNVTMTFPLTVFGVSVPVGVALTPSASGGELVLTPASLRLAGAQVTADALRQRLGALADGVLRDWRVCLASDLPRGIRLESVEVSGAALVASLSIDGRIAADPALQQPGSCA